MHITVNIYVCIHLVQVYFVVYKIGTVGKLLLFGAYNVRDSSSI